MKTEKALIKNVEALEKNLSPEQIARMGSHILNKCWNEDPHLEKNEKEFEAWSERYVEHQNHSERVKIAFELQRLVISRLMFEYFKKCLALNESAVLHILNLRLEFHMARLLKQMEKTIKGDIPKEFWEKYLQENPEDMDFLIVGEDEVSSLEKQGITEDQLDTLQKELYENYNEIISNSELWNLIGYSPPKSDFLEYFEKINAAINRFRVALNSEREAEHNE